MWNSKRGKTKYRYMYMYDIVCYTFKHPRKSVDGVGSLAPHVMVFIPHTRVLTMPLQSPTDRNVGWGPPAPKPEPAAEQRHQHHQYPLYALYNPGNYSCNYQGYVHIQKLQNLAGKLKVNWHKLALGWNINWMSNIHMYTYSYCSLSVTSEEPFTHMRRHLRMKLSRDLRSQTASLHSPCPLLLLLLLLESDPLLLFPCQSQAGSHWVTGPVEQPAHWMSGCIKHNISKWVWMTNTEDSHYRPIISLPCLLGPEYS